MPYVFLNEDAFHRVKFSKFSMQYVFEMIAERCQIEIKYMKMLNKHYNKWTRIIKDTLLLECNGIRLVFAEFLIECLETANISRMVADGINADDGPLMGIKLWIKSFDNHNEGVAAKKEYETAIVRFRTMNQRITKYMTRYLTRRRTTDILTRRRETLRIKYVNKPHKQVKYLKEIKSVGKKLEHVHNEAEMYREKYQVSLKKEEKQRAGFKNTMADIKKKFDNFEEERLVTLFGFLKTFLSLLQKSDTEREKRVVALQQIEHLVETTNPREEVLKWDVGYMTRQPHPVFQEYTPVADTENDSRIITSDSETDVDIPNMKQEISPPSKDFTDTDSDIAVASTSKDRRRSDRAFSSEKSNDLDSNMDVASTSKDRRRSDRALSLKKSIDLDSNMDVASTSKDRRRRDRALSLEKSTDLDSNMDVASTSKGRGRGSRAPSTSQSQKSSDSDMDDRTTNQAFIKSSRLRSKPVRTRADMDNLASKKGEKVVADDVRPKCKTVIMKKQVGKDSNKDDSKTKKESSGILKTPSNSTTASTKPAFVKRPLPPPPRVDQRLPHSPRAESDKSLEDVSEMSLCKETFANRKAAQKIPPPPARISSSSSEVEVDSDDIDIAKLGKVKVVALDSYTAKKEGELSFKTGQTIKQKYPANDKGMAFGYIRKGKLRRKKYGLYPVKLVVLKVKSKKSKLKKAKKHTKESSEDTDDDSNDVEIKPRKVAGSPTEPNDSKIAHARGVPKPKMAFQDPDETDGCKDPKGKRENNGSEDKTRGGLKNSFRKLFKHR